MRSIVKGPRKEEEAMRRCTLKLLLAVAGTLVVSAGIATAAGTGTLETEDLLAPAETFSSTASCDTDGTSTVSWTAEGIASGPYPGTFTASGSLTIAPQTLPGRPPGTNTQGTVAGPLETFEESFTIQSGATTITGTKTLHPLSSSTGTCQQVTQLPVLDFFDGQGEVVEVGATTRYAAEISGPSGSSSDSGVAIVSLADIRITGSCPAGSTCEARLAGFNQFFNVSDQNVPCEDPNGDNNHQGDEDEDEEDEECEDEDEDEDEQ
jgi:hypothetical protein